MESVSGSNSDPGTERKERYFYSNTQKLFKTPNISYILT